MLVGSQDNFTYLKATTICPPIPPPPPPYPEYKSLFSLSCSGAFDLSLHREGAFLDQ